jgi:hypothetical protein
VSARKVYACGETLPDVARDIADNAVGATVPPSVRLHVGGIFRAHEKRC